MLVHKPPSFLSLLINHYIWKHHVDSITKKANSTRAFLQRNIHQCPRKTKELCYTTLVRPIVEYAGIIWDPSRLNTSISWRWCSDVMHVLCLEITEQPSSVSAMINQLQWPTLQERRAQAKATMMYRIVYNLVDIPHTFLTPTVALRGHSSRYIVPFTRTGVYRQSFFPDSIRIWNRPSSRPCQLCILTSFKQGVQSVQLRLSQPSCF